jgi:dTDP-4-dehydrorhamnose reductase
MNILLLGKNGQLGWELQRSLAVLGHVTALDRQSQSQGSPHCGDLCNLDGLAQTVRELQPDVIVNAAAYTAVDKAESQADVAHLVNAQAPAVLAREAEKIGATLIHYSTDYVFNGRGDKAWQEADAVAPLNVYGASKLAGEQAIQALCERHVIFRTSWVYAARGGNFAKTMLRLAKERDELAVIADQWGAPTGADLLADVSAHVIAHVAVQTTGQSAGESAHKHGLYHLAAAGETTWHAYAQRVIQTANAQGIETRVRAHQIKAIPSSAYPVPAQRPLNSRLSTQRLREAFGLTLPAWQQGVTRLVQTWV